VRKFRAKDFPSLPFLLTKNLSAYIISLKGKSVVKRRVRFIYAKQGGIRLPRHMWHQGVGSFVHGTGFFLGEKTLPRRRKEEMISERKEQKKNTSYF